MEVRKMALEAIKPAEYNPRKELKPGDADYESLDNSLRRFGQVEPLIWNETTETLVSGHQRLNVLKAQGAAEAEVVVVRLDPTKERLLNLAINKIDGEWDYDKLHELFGELGDEDIAATGFTSEEISELFGDEPIELDTYEVSEAPEPHRDRPDAEQEAPAGEFQIYMSFANKALAEEWLADHGIDKEYGDGEYNINVKMNGGSLV